MIAAPTEEDPEKNPGDLGRKVRAGVGWSLVNSVSARLLTVASGMVIARLIAPKDFGVYSIGFLVLTVLTSMNELGVGVTVMRSPTDPTPLTPTAVTLSVGNSLLVYAAIALTAPALARVLGAPEAAAVIRVIALNVVLDGISSIPNALLMRSFHQGRRTIVDLVAFFPGAGVSIALVAAGWGPMGLAIGSLAGNLTAVVLVYALAPSRPAPGWKTGDARVLLASGLPFAATSAVYLATLNVDYVVIARLLGTTALGFYVLAFNLSSWPANLVSLSIRRVAIPGFSQLAHDLDTLRRAFARSLHLVAAVAVLVAVLLSLLATPVITLFYGRNWLPAVAALRWLALLGGARVTLDLCYDVLVAVGRGRLLLLVQAVWFLALVIALPLGAHAGGIRGVAIGHVLIAAGVVGPIYAVALRRARLSLRSAVSALGWPVLAGCLTAGLLTAAIRMNLGPWASLFLLSSGASVLYLAMMCLNDENRTMIAGAIARMGLPARSRA